MDPRNQFLFLLLSLAGCLLAGCSDIFGDSFKAGDLSEQELEQVISEGLEAWRKSGSTLEGAACANCHAPDALDLAYYDFDANTIRRRAEHHTGRFPITLTRPEINQIIKLVEALRVKYRIEPRNHMTDRPLQPGGGVLPGETAGERDRAFGRQLVRQAYRFATLPVLDEEETLRQRDEWLRADPRALQIGIPLNRWSEDPHHGIRHASMADWLPDLPRVPKEGRSEAWYGVHDAYLEYPTDDNLRELLRAEAEMTRSIYPGNSRRFFHEKYRSVLVAQHLFRQEVTGGQPLPERPASAAPTLRGGPEPYGENPVWEVGEMTHAYKEGKVGEEEFQIPRAVRRGLHPTGSIAGEMYRMRVPWFYAGWLLDQGLQHSGEREATKSGRYFAFHLHTDDGYPLHNIFAITRKMIVQNYGGQPPDSAGPPVVDYSDFNNWEFAMAYEPEGMEARKL